MRSKLLILLAGLSFIRLSGISLQAQSTYFQAVTNLNPAAYWPMQETNAPAPSNVETNLGSLGSLANAYYVDTQGTNPVGRRIGGALAVETYLAGPWIGPGTARRGALLE